jgi:hypothetical protein
LKLGAEEQSALVDNEEIGSNEPKCPYVLCPNLCPFQLLLQIFNFRSLWAGQGIGRDGMGWGSRAVTAVTTCMHKVEMKRDHVSTFPLNST